MTQSVRSSTTRCRNNRADHTAFGEEIASDVGLRTSEQGFGDSVDLRQKYGLTERDEATGLDHTWFRKHENRAGRWTSPDPFNGSCSRFNPQSFNRFQYAINSPTNFIDPTGLVCYGFNVWIENYENGHLVSVIYLGFITTSCTVNVTNQPTIPDVVDSGNSGTNSLSASNNISNVGGDDEYDSYEDCVKSEKNICHAEGEAKFWDVLTTNVSIGGGAGAGIGTMISPGAGTVVGGIIGGATGVAVAARVGEAAENLCKTKIEKTCHKYKKKARS